MKHRSYTKFLNIMLRKRSLYRDTAITWWIHTFITVYILKNLIDSLNLRTSRERMLLHYNQALVMTRKTWNWFRISWEWNAKILVIGLHAFFWLISWVGRYVIYIITMEIWNQRINSVATPMIEYWELVYSSLIRQNIIHSYLLCFRLILKF